MASKGNLLIGILITSVIYMTGYWYGSSVYKLQMQDMELELLTQSAKHKQEASRQEQEYSNMIQEKEGELEDLHESFISTINSFSGSYNKRLLESENRTRYYKSLSEAGSDGCTELVGVTEAYDRNLTRGIYLVRKLSEATTTAIRQSEVMIEAMEQRNEIVK